MAAFSIVEDTYNLRARVAPSIIVVLPLMLAISSWWPGETKWPGILAGLGVSLALGTLLSQLGRDLGKERQADLFKKWGGTPTTQLLSHRNSTLNPHTLARYHESLRQLRPDLTLPRSKDAEVADSAAADAAYVSCIDTLRELARDKIRYPLVFEENVGFGFRRNLWAMKPTGILIAVGSAAACLSRTWNQLIAEQPIEMAPVVFGVLCIFLFVIWTVRITPMWIRVAGFAYAERLLGICESIPPAQQESRIART